MIRVVHTADTHLGYRQYHKAEREDDFKQAFIGVIEYAIENDVNAVVHGGDLFHNSQPGTDPFMVAIEQLQRLKALGFRSSPWSGITTGKAVARNGWTSFRRWG